MNKLYELNALDKKIRNLLISVACGATEKVVREDDADGAIFLTDYETFGKSVGLQQEDLFEALDRISRHDFYEQGKAPMLEALLQDMTAGFFDCPSRREGFYKLLSELYGVPGNLSFQEAEGFAKKEERKAEWFYRTNGTLGEHVLRSLNDEQVIVSQKELEALTWEDLPAIIMRSISRPRFVNLPIRYIIMDEKPRFGYAEYGDYFFENNQLYVFTRDRELEPWHSWRTAERLFPEANKIFSAECFAIDEDYVDEETGDLEHVSQSAEDVARRRFEDGGWLLVPVIFAGIQTPFKDAETGERIYTGDVVRVESEKNNITAGIGVLPGQARLALILDNHCLPLSADRPTQLHKAGSVFYNLNSMMHELNVDQLCAGLAQSRSEKDVLAVKVKASPCFGQEDWKWAAGIKLGIYG